MTEEDEEFQRLEREVKLRRMAEEDDDIQVYKKPWVGLTDHEIEMIYAVTIKIRKKDIMPGEQEMFAKTIQQFLKDKNT